jgi:hypothetical protein
MQVSNLPVKMTRYWNELLVKDVPSNILYSLSDYCPGMPREAVIVKDNEALGLPVYRPDEAKYGDIDPATRRKTVDVNGTIQALIGFGAIPDEEQASLESYMFNVQEMIMKYDRLAKCWPFLIAERLLKIQMGRLHHIKAALTEKLHNHPLSSANCASFGSNIPTGIPSALADFSSDKAGRKQSDNSDKKRKYKSDRFDKKRKRTDASDFKSKSSSDSRSKRSKSRSGFKPKPRGSTYDSKRKGRIPLGEQCRRINCKQRGNNANHRHDECRYKDVDHTVKDPNLGNESTSTHQNGFNRKLDNHPLSA